MIIELEAALAVGKGSQRLESSIDYALTRDTYGGHYEAYRWLSNGVRSGMW
jgi:hypothetical protein